MVVHLVTNVAGKFKALFPVSRIHSKATITRDQPTAVLISKKLHTKTPATMIDAPRRHLIGPSVTHVSTLPLIRDTAVQGIAKREGKSGAVDM